MIIHKILQDLLAFNTIIKIVTSFPGILGEMQKVWKIGQHLSVVTSNQVIGIADAVQLNHFILDISLLASEIININIINIVSGIW